MWSVELEPEVEQWIDALSVAEFAAVLAHVERLAERGNALRMPASRTLGGGLSSCDSTSFAWRGDSRTPSPMVDASCS